MSLMLSKLCHAFPIAASTFPSPLGHTRYHDYTGVTIATQTCVNEIMWDASIPRDGSKWQEWDYPMSWITQWVVDYNASGFDGMEFDLMNPLGTATNGQLWRNCDDEIILTGRTPEASGEMVKIITRTNTAIP